MNNEIPMIVWNILFLFAVFGLTFQVIHVLITLVNRSGNIVCWKICTLVTYVVAYFTFIR